MWFCLCAHNYIWRNTIEKIQEHVHLPRLTTTLCDSYGAQMMNALSKATPFNCAQQRAVSGVQVKALQSEQMDRKFCAFSSSARHTRAAKPSHLQRVCRNHFTPPHSLPCLPKQTCCNSKLRKMEHPALLQR